MLPRRELEESDRLARALSPPQNPCMQIISAFRINEYDRDLTRVAIPHPAVQIVARFGPTVSNGLDVHAFGVQQRVRRKLIRAGQWAVMASLHPGTARAVLGIPADAIVGRVLAL